ncbi:hypothetical protein BJV77DRAFT_1032284 [Russula vinacea]|nr:hypothetical protein BJV77DRAFT_1032284 [Russula vinacea]
MAEHVSDTFLTREASKRVCIIGAGANGLATLKVLAETHQVQSGQWSLVAFEERDNVGGTWYPAPSSENPPLTPLYDSLSANLPLPVMTYPTAVVQKYLEDYATHFGLLRYLFWDADSIEWDFKFDFVVVANGHHRKPRYPDAAGLQGWLDSGRAIHSAWYRRPGEFAHHKSGIDICRDMTGIIQLLLHSVPSTPQTGQSYSDDSETYRKVGRVVEYRGGGSVLLEDGSIESDIDLVILATGYEFSFPFLSQIKSGIPSLPPPLPNELYNSTYHIFPLALHLFPLQGDFPPTSIAFTGLVYRVAPFLLFEDQARAVVRVLEDPASLDCLSGAVNVVARAHRLMRERETDDPLHIAKAWFRLAPLEPLEYRAQLNAFSGKNWTARSGRLSAGGTGVRYEQSGGQSNRGVGLNGMEDWIELCRKLIKQSKTSAEP